MMGLVRLSVMTGEVIFFLFHLKLEGREEEGGGRISVREKVGHQRL